MQIGEPHHCLLRGFSVWNTEKPRKGGWKRIADLAITPVGVDGCCCETNPLPFAYLNWPWKQCPMYTVDSIDSLCIDHLHSFTHTFIIFSHLMGFS